MATPLFIADAATMDSASSRGDCGFPPTPFGVAIPCAKVVVGSGPLMIIPDGTVGTPVPGVGVLCGVVTRTAKVKVNQGKGFVVIEGKVPCLARGLPGSGGDVAEGTPATPTERPFTAPITHAKIVVGSGGSYVPPELTE